MKIKMPENMSRAFSKIGFELNKRSPEIFVGVGIVGVVAGTVMACKATTKLSEIMDDSKSQLDDIHEAMSNEKLIESGKYSEEDGKKDLTIVYTQTALKVVKLYAPSVAVSALSIGCIIKGTGILKKRNIALASAYGALFNDFKGYRERITEKFGEDIEHEIRHGIKAREVEETSVDENGNKKTTKKTVISSTHDSYTRIFDELNPFFERSAIMNKSFLMGRQHDANARLRTHGYLFLNDVYDMLGFDRTKEGQVIGWKYNPSNPNCNNYVDFGIFSPANSEFVNEYEAAIWLDFNVDGNIWETM